MKLTNLTAITVSIILTIGGLVPINTPTTTPTPSPTPTNPEINTQLDPNPDTEIDPPTEPPTTPEPEPEPEPETNPETENPDTSTETPDPTPQPTENPQPPTDTPQPFTDSQNPATQKINFNMQWAEPIKPLPSYKKGFYANLTILKNANPETPINGKLALTKTQNNTKTLLNTKSINLKKASDAKPILIQDQTYTPTNTPTTYTLTFTPDATEPPNKYTNTTFTTTLKITIQTTKVKDTNLTGKTLTVPQSDPYALKGTITQTQGTTREIQIQKHNPKTKKWETIKTVTTNSATGKWSHVISKTTEATQLYRYHAPASLGTTAYTSPNTKITRPPGTYRIETHTPDKTRQVPWDTNTQSFFIDTKQTKKTLTYQYKTSTSSWKTLKVIKSNTKPSNYTFNMLKGTKSSNTQNLYYRLVISSDTYHKPTTSKTTHVVWENPNKYTGLQKEFYDYAKFACPNTFIRFNNNFQNQGKWGEATLGADITTVFPGVPGHHRRTVALHECAHHVQYQTSQNRHNKGWQNYLTKANQHHGTTGQTGMERTAECMAQMWAPNTYWSYGADCRYNRYDFALKTIRGQSIQ